MLVGRDLMKKMKNKEKFVIATKLLIDSSGKKMGKTEGNMVALGDSPEEIFGKVMSWNDNLIIPGFELITDIVVPTADEVNANPKQFKTSLAKEIVKMVYDEESAKKSHESFEKTFSGDGVPEDIQEIKAPHGSHIKDALVQSGIVSSNADWRRLVEGNAVTVMDNQETIKDPFVKAEKDMTLRIGKKRFVKIVVQ
jgi:tyrosyl-tRNA synthetase